MVALGGVAGDLQVERASAARSSAQTSVAFQQRVRNRQPDGGFERRGHLALEQDPLACAARASSFGAADISAAVYGWLGRSKTASVGPVSMIRPRYITATRSATCRTTDRSWEMKT